MAFEKKYMERAILLAKKGIGAVNPNPLVGAVIVKDGKIIGEGYHEKYGCLHAEREAFKNLSEAATGAEMYVTLEPCCHYGKQPPCTLAIIENKIKTVYVGSDDPNGLVAGKGISFLRENGVEVYTGMMKKECDALNPVFFHYITKKTPYIVMKYGMTMDGKLATYTGKSKWVTNEQSREEVQKYRNELTGIMVGIGTVLADNPMLTCRIDGGRNPVRIICDSRLRIPLDSNIVKTAASVKTIVAAVKNSDSSFLEKKNNLVKAGVEVLETEAFEDKVDLSALMVMLGEKKLDSILLEGGGQLNWNMVSMGLVNEVRAFIAAKIFGGENSKTPVEGQGFPEVDMAKNFTLSELRTFDNDIFARYIRRDN